MRDNVRHFLQLVTEVLDVPGPVVEIGALQTEQQEDYADMRPFFGDRLFLGCDMRAGAGVQCLADAHRFPFRNDALGTVLLLDTLEHLRNPATAVDEAYLSIQEGGIVVLTSVMNFPIHSFPSDYWRFTPAVFDYLLRELPARAVFSQGDSEFPHTVIGLGSKVSDNERAGQALLAAAQEIETRWPEMEYGGPLLRWRPSAVVLSQRVDERRLPDLERGRVIAQSFVCPSDNMSRIDIKMSNPGPPSLCHVLFRLHEDGEEGREIAAYRVLVPHVIDKAWTFVPVPAQDASAGRSYVLTMESPDAGPSQTVTAFGSNAATYEQGQLRIDGQPAAGSLCFQVYCQTTAGEEGSPATEPLAETGARRVLMTGEPKRMSTAPTLRAEEERWEQARYLAAVVESGLDRVRADLKATEQRLDKLERVQQQALDQSTEAAALVRSLKRNPLYGLWRRIFR